MASERPAGKRLGWGRAALLASGDFACNLYWQSATLYLLFFDTDVLRLAPYLAGLIYFAGLVWDGLVGLLVGLLADRGTGPHSMSRTLVAWAAAPLAVSFLLLYAAPPARGTLLGLLVLAVHLAFRTCYAAANIPYVALLAEMSGSGPERARLAGLRMLFGAAAATIVGSGTQRISSAVTGTPASAAGYLTAAAIWACAATMLLLAVARAAAPRPLRARDLEGSPVKFHAAPWRNRAFVTLNAAMIASVLAVTMITKSTLYYFKYALGDEAGGGTALALMGLAGVGFVPVWMAVASRWGVRAQWLAGAAVGIAAIAGFAAAQPRSAASMDLFLILFQAAASAFAFGYWAMLPDAIEYGTADNAGRHVGMFGIAAILQKASLGAAAALVGVALSAAGYQPNLPQRPETLAALTAAMTLVPALALLASAAAIALTPLRPRRLRPSA
ncbi:MAG: MFS transporter [Alphaproteobacteria bacterium]|nr:MFS transporter [Alphaproteobacteria bacterium]